MISDEQRTQLGLRTYLMDLADRNATLTPHDMNKLLQAFGIEGFTDDELIAIANPPQKEKQVAKQPSELDAEALMQVIAEMQKSLHSTDTARAAQPEGLQVQPTAAPKHKGPSRADLQAELFTELVFGGKTYTADQMAHKLARLMKLSDVKSDPVTPSQMSLHLPFHHLHLM